MSLITTPYSHRLNYFAGSFLLLSLGACSSDNHYDQSRFITPAPTAPETVAPVWTKGEYRPASEFAGLCEHPKSGINPFTGEPYAHRQGTAMHEKMWLRSISNEYYLWYDQLPDINPQGKGTIEYFQLLKTPQDRFHYADPVEAAFNSAQSGVFLDHGIRWHVSGDNARELRVADLARGYELEGELNRGDVLVAVNGASIADHTQEEAAIIYAGLNPTADDVNHIFTLIDAHTGELKHVMVTARALEHDPVPRYSIIEHNEASFGYLQFDDHSAIAEPRLINAVAELSESGIDELILDLRYNRGGYMLIASQLSYMIAGAGSTDGMPFVYERFNDKHREVNPFTGDSVFELPFLTLSVPKPGTAQMPLPTLDLDRVYVLTSGSTCSASEAIINGLKGVGVEVVQVGNATCGKPYTFMPVENCGVFYQTVFYSNENAMGFGDYLNGFRPTNGVEMETASVLPGCTGEDDLDHALGSPEEALVAAALQWHDTQTCPTDGNDTLTAQAVGAGSVDWFAGREQKWDSSALLTPVHTRD